MTCLETTFNGKDTKCAGLPLALGKTTIKSR